MTFLHNMTLITIQAILGSNSLAQRQSKQQIIYDFLLWFEWHKRAAFKLHYARKWTRIWASLKLAPMVGNQAPAWSSQDMWLSEFVWGQYYKHSGIGNFGWTRYPLSSHNCRSVNVCRTDPKESSVRQSFNPPHFFTTRVSPSTTSGPTHCHTLHTHATSPSHPLHTHSLLSLPLFPGKVAPVLAILLPTKDSRWALYIVTCLKRFGLEGYLGTARTGHLYSKTSRLVPVHTKTFAYWDTLSFPINWMVPIEAPVQASLRFSLLVSYCPPWAFAL